MCNARWLFLLLTGGLMLWAAPAAAQGTPGQPITADNWGQAVGFAPDLNAVKVSPGATVSSANFAQWKHALPETFDLLVNKYKLKLTLQNYKPMYPSVGYIEATNKYAGQPQLIDTGSDFRKIGLKNYTGGLPFPNPKSGIEVAWDYIYSYTGDDGDLYYAVYWIDANSGVQHFEEWRWYFIIRAMFRTDLDPKPNIPKFEKEGIQYASITYALSPADKKGFGALYSRNVEPRDQQGHIYVPAMKRVLRNTFGTRGDTWNSTDLLYEDVRGYMGYPEWMNWKLLGKKTYLMPMRADIKLGKDQANKTYDFANYPHWNPNMKWEPRPVYVVEVTPKLKDYPYSRMNMYIDAETYMILYKESFDKKGQIWKLLITGFNEPQDMNSSPPVYATQLVIDVQAEHATAFPIYEYKSNQNLNPDEFTESVLRKRGR
ncbi:MAG: DUF1329 domain-containing protein [Myxococcales bacterium]|nr:MAG: DUF1329 domain-containing protein [Myxococcales bacterium]